MKFELDEDQRRPLTCHDAEHARARPSVASGPVPIVRSRAKLDVWSKGEGSALGSAVREAGVGRTAPQARIALEVVAIKSDLLDSLLDVRSVAGHDAPIGQLGKPEASVWPLR